MEIKLVPATPINKIAKENTLAVFVDWSYSADEKVICLSIIPAEAKDNQIICNYLDYQVYKKYIGDYIKQNFIPDNMDVDLLKNRSSRIFSEIDNHSGVFWENLKHCAFINSFEI